MPRTARRSAARAAAALALALAAPAAFAAETTRQLDRTFATAPGRSFSLLNLAGNVTIVQGAGSEIRLAATVHAEGDDAAAAARLAGLLDLQVDESAARISVKAKYPLDTYRKYSYPRRSDVESLPWFLEWLDFGSSSSKYDGVPVRILAKRAAPVLFADFRIEVPAGTAVAVETVIGELRSESVAADLQLELGSGLIDARDGSGVLRLETGSGDIEVRAQSGLVRAETGSGDVRIEGVTGESVIVETGSGDVRLLDVAAAISAETGSGDIVADGVTAGATLSAETGSGDVRIAGDLSAVTRLEIGTGSGDVSLDAARAPQLRLSVSTGSGEITLDIPGARVTRNDGDAVRAEIGAATGTGSISTGSGDVTLRSRG